MWELQYTYNGVDDLRYFKSLDEFLDWIGRELELVKKGALEDFSIISFKEVQ